MPAVASNSPIMSAITSAVSNAVESVTNAMATTKIADPTGATNEAGQAGQANDATKAANDEAVLASAAEGRRLYIGNLAYATTEAELKEFFKDYLV